MKRDRAIACCLMLCGSLAAPAAARGMQQDVQSLVRSGNFVRALELASAETDALVRARAELQVRYHAGDYPGALQAGLGGLRTAAGDLELLSGVAELCLTLHLGASAGEHLTRLEAAVATASLGAADREWWSGRILDLRQRVDELRARHTRRETAMVRARWVVGVVLAALVGWTWWLVRGHAGARVIPSARGAVADGR